MVSGSDTAAAEMAERQLSGPLQVLDEIEGYLRAGNTKAIYGALFIWTQNRDSILDGTTTWDEQWGPHRETARNERAVKVAEALGADRVIPLGDVSSLDLLGLPHQLRRRTRRPSTPTTDDT